MLRICEVSERMNFREAGVVVQACTNVYSRKVEYVYGFTNTVFEQLHGRRIRNEDPQDHEKGMH